MIKSKALDKAAKEYCLGEPGTEWIYKAGYESRSAEVEALKEWNDNSQSLTGLLEIEISRKDAEILAMQKQHSDLKFSLEHWVSYAASKDIQTGKLQSKISELEAKFAIAIGALRILDYIKCAREALAQISAREVQ